jgi:hypothetical protein
VGEDVENILLKLIQAADYDIEKAEPASSTSTRSTRSPARARTSRSPATCRARACSRRCSRSSRARWPACRRRGAQAPAPGVHPDRHHQHPVHLRRRLRRPRQDHRRDPVEEGPARGRATRDDRAGRSREIRAYPGIHRPPARGRHAPRAQRRPGADPRRAEERGSTRSSSSWKMSSCISPRRPSRIACVDKEIRRGDGMFDIPQGCIHAGRGRPPAYVSRADRASRPRPRTGRAAHESRSGSIRMLAGRR